MRRQGPGPRRAASVESYLRETRILAILALAAFVAGIVSDDTNGAFWARHSLLGGLVASVIVVMLSVAVINEVIERRRRQRWSVLAQYVMFELIRNARMIWSGIVDVAGLLPVGASLRESMDRGAEVVHDTARLTAALRRIIDDDRGRARLHDGIGFLAEQADEVLGRWASVMLNAEVYAEIIDRHVELAGDVAWIGALLDATRPPSDRRHKRARSNPAVLIESDLSTEWLADRIVVIAQLAENLDRGTLEIALRIVPIDWWQARLSTAPGAASQTRPE